MIRLERNPSTSLLALPSVYEKKQVSNIDKDWKEVAVHSICAIPTDVEIDIADVVDNRKGKEPLDIDESAVASEGSKRGIVGYAKDFAISFAVESVEVGLALPLLPIYVTADYFSHRFGQKVKGICWSYREKIHNIAGKIEDFFNVKEV